jgi:molecular chaperone GrpE
MADKEKSSSEDAADSNQPNFTDKRRVDPETGEVRNKSGSEDAISDLSEQDIALLAEAERDLVAEFRDRAARAEAELQNFRNRVERDRQANRESVIVEVIRSLLPVIDDLDRAEAHGDLVGTPLELVAKKVRSTFDRYGVKAVGTVGEIFDPALHEAVVRKPEAGVKEEILGEIVEVGYSLGERLVRAAKVVVKVPEDG